MASFAFWPLKLTLRACNPGLLGSLDSRELSSCKVINIRATSPRCTLNLLFSQKTVVAAISAVAAIRPITK